MKNVRKNNGITRLQLVIYIALILLLVGIFNWKINNKKIYFNKPVSWDTAYAYLCDENGVELTGAWPGIEMKQEKDYIYYLSVNKNTNDISNCNIIFNNGGSEFRYQVSTQCEGYDKIYNLTTGIGENGVFTGEWLDYSKDIKFGKNPTTKKKINNVILMIGDGMGENHIKAGEIYKGETLKIQTIKNKTYVKTASFSTVTDSAASATALATGKKTVNQFVGKDKNGENLENLIEYSNKRGLKTGIVCTQILCHATPASFSVHNTYRYNYAEIVDSQINSGIDLMLGGGRIQFSGSTSEMSRNNYTWVNNFSELKNVDKNEKVIGTFADDSISLEENRVSLSDMTKTSLERLQNNNGFFTMIEGSDIDIYSHESDMSKMLTEMIDFDNAVGVAMKYVDENPDTLLVVTADHETGGINLNGVIEKEQLTNELFTSNGQHTERNVLAFAYGCGAEDLTQYDVIDNTSIYKFIKQGLEN